LRQGLLDQKLCRAEFLGRPPVVHFFSSLPPLLKPFSCYKMALNFPSPVSSGFFVPGKFQ
jgi:hypothetical protein